MIFRPYKPDGPSRPRKRYCIVYTRNGGHQGTVTKFTSSAAGQDGYNECFRWILDNTSFGFHEATTRQGYRVVPLDGGPHIHLGEALDE